MKEWTQWLAQSIRTLQRSLAEGLKTRTYRSYHNWLKGTIVQWVECKFWAIVRSGIEIGRSLCQREFYTCIKFCCRYTKVDVPIWKIKWSFPVISFALFFVFDTKQCWVGASWKWTPSGQWPFVSVPRNPWSQNPSLDDNKIETMCLR